MYTEKTQQVIQVKKKKKNWDKVILKLNVSTQIFCHYRKVNKLSLPNLIQLHFIYLYAIFLFHSGKRFKICTPFTSMMSVSKPTASAVYLLMSTGEMSHFYAKILYFLFKVPPLRNIFTYFLLSRFVLLGEKKNNIHTSINFSSFLRYKLWWKTVFGSFYLLVNRIRKTRCGQRSEVSSRHV